MDMQYNTSCRNNRVKSTDSFEAVQENPIGPVHAWHYIEFCELIGIEAYRVGGFAFIVSFERISENYV